ncbi:ARRD3 protein, partial [Polyodon spathula]|nr:ARRD3 protein [Polyodon spathula]
MKEVKQLIANLRGESLSSGKTETWSGKMLKIPPVSPSILDCSIIRVEYSLMVYVDIPGAMNLLLNLPLVIGTIPLHPFGSRTSSVSSQCSMNMNWLSMALPERPEAPPSYAEIATEQRQNGMAPPAARDDFERALEGPLFAYIQEFRFQPPPLYSEEPAALHNSLYTVMGSTSPKLTYFWAPGVPAVSTQPWLGNAFTNTPLEWKGFVVVVLQSGRSAPCCKQKLSLRVSQPLFELHATSTGMPPAIPDFLLSSTHGEPTAQLFAKKHRKCDEVHYEQRKLSDTFLPSGGLILDNL